MAQAETKYTPIGDKWIPSNEAVAQLAHFHASHTERLYAYDGDGFAEMQLAIQCGLITCGLLVLSDGTQEGVKADYLLYDPNRLATGYDRERHATIYLERAEIRELVGKTAEQPQVASEQTEPPSPADTSGHAPAANLNTEEWIKYVWPREAKALAEAKDRTEQSKVLARLMGPAKDRGECKKAVDARTIEGYLRKLNLR